ncbi:MAG: type II toxin-antitoxin system prevent-host-death family antitoxin [Deltaproteobacteria bacterium]|nr:type II toxin-antitoxin system prevent-host-death family antitoxin [Deltaproteobacteria bacterium]
MQDFKISENIIPVSEFKAKAAHWLRRLAKTRNTIIITQKGKAAGVLLSPDAFDELTERLRLTQAVEQGLADVEAGRVYSHESVVEEMDTRFNTKNRK